VRVHGDIERLLQTEAYEYACLEYGEKLYPAMVDFCEMTGIRMQQVKKKPYRGVTHDPGGVRDIKTYFPCTRHTLARMLPAWIIV